MAHTSPMGPGFFPAPQPSSDPNSENPAGDGGVRLSEFTLAHVPDARQLALRHGNPLCTLFAGTPAGARVCNHGCGVSGPQSPAVHVCPFGMAMHRLPDDAPLGRLRHNRQTHWIGRRFVSAAALHEALDGLVAQGMDEATILDHLPVNPVVEQESLNDAAHERSVARIIPMNSGPADIEARREAAHEAAYEAAAPENKIARTTSSSSASAASSSASPSRSHAASSGLSTLGAVLEYLAQMTHILAAVEQPTKICERFLKAVGAALPFEQSTILLRRRVKSAPDAPAHLGDELVTTATIPARESAARDAKRPSLTSHELGPIALAESRVMIERDHRIAAFNPNDAPRTAGTAIAVPLSPFGAKALGVWLARFSAEPSSAPWSEESVRLMQSLAELLAVRLSQVMASAPAQAPEHATPAAAATPAAPRAAAPAMAAPVWSDADLLAALRPEAARAVRAEAMLTLVRLRLAAAKGSRPLPVAPLAKGLRAALRPYDLLSMAGADSGAQWNLILPHGAGADVDTLVGRLQTLVEDVLDANGGLEERGLRVALGLSTLGSDAADAAELAAHAAQAADQALARAEPSAIERYQAPAPQRRHASAGR